jgi:hypothetical protein
MPVPVQTRVGASLRPSPSPAQLCKLRALSVPSVVRVSLLFVLRIPADALPPPDVNATHADSNPPLPARRHVPRLDIDITVPAPNIALPVFPTNPNPTHRRNPYPEFRAVPPGLQVSTAASATRQAPWSAAASTSEVASTAPPAPALPYHTRPRYSQQQRRRRRRRRHGLHYAHHEHHAQHAHYAPPAPAPVAESQSVSASTPRTDGASPFASSSSSAYPAPGHSAQWGANAEAGPALFPASSSS